jgi:DNA invertase Pin-like site-specific DNA recombinase
MIMGKTAKTCAIYARYSSDMQKATSIDGQLLLCRKVAERNCFKIVGEFVDAAKSGLTENARDGYQQMLDGVRNRDFDVVIVEHFDRLSRDPAAIARLFQLFAYNEVQLMDQRGIPATATDISIASLYNTIYKPQLAEKVRRGHDAAVASGKIPGAYAYGYRPKPGSPGERIIDAAERAIIIRIFSEYASGRSTREIAADLTEEGVPSPGASRHKDKGGRTVWNHQCITGGRYGRGIIGNELYIGRISWNLRSTVINPETQKKQKRRNPEELHTVVERPELRIVPQELWDTAQKVRASRAMHMFGSTGKPQRRPVIPRNNEHPLAGVLRCGVCNGHMRIAQSSRNGAPRSACANAHQRSTCDHNRSFDMDVLLTDIAQKLETILLSPKAIENAVAAWNEERKNDRKKDSERANLEKRLRVLTTEIERLSHAIANSKRKPDELVRMLDERDVERASVDEQLRLLGSEGDNIVPFKKGGNRKITDEYEADVKRLVSLLRTNPKNIETRLAFRSLINTIVLHPTRKRMPYEYTPYINKGVLLGMKLFPINRRSTEEIVGSQGFTKYDIVMHQKSVSS